MSPCTEMSGFLMSPVSSTERIASLTESGRLA